MSRCVRGIQSHGTSSDTAASGYRWPLTIEWPTQRYDEERTREGGGGVEVLRIRRAVDEWVAAR